MEMSLSVIGHGNVTKCYITVLLAALCYIIVSLACYITLSLAALCYITVSLACYITVSLAALCYITVSLAYVTVSLATFCYITVSLAALCYISYINVLLGTLCYICYITVSLAALCYITVSLGTLIILLCHWVPSLYYCVTGYPHYITVSLAGQLTGDSFHNQTDFCLGDALHKRKLILLAFSSI